MTEIRPLWTEMPLQPLRAQEREATNPISENPFTDIFRSAIDAVKETDAEETQLEYLMSTGQLDNPVPLLLAANKAGLSVSLLVQLRNKAQEAYNELSRISL